MSYLPVDFRTIGIADDSTLELQINEELSDFFPPPSSPPSVLTNSSEIGLRSEDLDDSDNDIEEKDEVGENDILGSPVIQSRIRDFIRCDSESENESESEEVETCSCFDVNTDLISSVDERKSKNKCQCLRQFRSNDVVENRINVSAMDSETRDVLIMGQLQACGTSKGEVTKQGKDRKRHKFDYQFMNSPVCKDCFLFVNNIGDKLLKNIRKHLYKEGAVPRVHGNTNRTPKHAVNYNDAQQVVKFITRFADQFGLPQPAAPRGRDDIPPVYLPGKESYKTVHQQYAEAYGSKDDNRVLSETTFRRIWHRVVHHVKFMTPRTDVCHKCEQFRDLIQQSRTEEEKLSATEAFSDHIKSAQRERDHYRSVCAAAKEELDGQPRSESPVTPCSKDLKNVHYTFDFAQSVLLPTHCRQEGALYFLSPFKVNLFGICNDGRTLQHNYVFGESQSIGEDGQ
ncbi:uncharacterized protein LOC117345170 [Pecten maximus]|uniref:uncharacterized protein LOC117345170 n=1 Tax=Pecten maximus TaxID=6579 RepID=UPI00145852BA|nr:uncharacterized protein LOC117345170 [Pecten maximus]